MLQQTQCLALYKQNTYSNINNFYLIKKIWEIIYYKLFNSTIVSKSTKNSLLKIYLILKQSKITLKNSQELMNQYKNILYNEYKYKTNIIIGDNIKFIYKDLNTTILKKIQKNIIQEKNIKIALYNALIMSLV
ncbi:hypothetical protein AB837_00109 [bacterium AB1]|nr:hypothetical protein AB837_00109 [bacterium AB1]